MYMKSRIVEIVDIVSLEMKSLGEKLTSWNRYFIWSLPNLFAVTDPCRGGFMGSMEPLF